MAGKAGRRGLALLSLWVALCLVAAAPVAASSEHHLRARRLLGDASAPVFWVLLVGDSSVGKSSMVKRFMEDAFDAKIRTTEGANGRQKPVQLKHGPAKLQVWDTAGGEAWKKPVTSIYRGVHAVMVVFDPHSAASFEHAQKHWIPEVAEFAAPRAFTYLVSTKDDLGPGVVNMGHAQAVANAHNMTYIRTSAKENRNVTSLFTAIGQRIQDAQAPAQTATALQPAVALKAAASSTS